VKAVLDTNVLIDFFRHPEHRKAFEARTLRPQLFMSSIVAMELFASCRNKQEEQALLGFLKPFEKAGRVLTPDAACFLAVGRVLANLGGEGMPVAQRRQIVNDAMIAVSATQEGAIVVTANARHFARIARYTPLRWMRPDG